MTDTATLVMLPGLLCDSRIFDAQNKRFPGSMVIDGWGKAASLSDMCRIVLDRAPDRMSLLGHSMGARVALEVWRVAPERVERLALLSTGVHDPKSDEAAQRMALLAIGRKEGAVALVDAWLPPMVSDRHAHDASFMEPLRLMCVSAGVDAFEAQIKALLGRPAVEGLLPSIACPTLVAVGDQDVWSPPSQHEMIASRIPNSRLVVVRGAAHMLPVEAPEVLNQAIAEWLALPGKAQ